jgi:hypothetical protein
MQKLKASSKFSRENDLRGGEVRRRVAECRGRLRKGRAARRIAVCATPSVTAAFGVRAEAPRAAAPRSGPAKAA